ncbi:endonuclease [uncultured Cocleimonas sp.]|uniref:endonuclease n=1 Tax=uncultured Cocleimonas sp. TaxID=1051587 RepID=UPI0026060AEE|nr:endonuclease [uncultured Cocleimonas sp.]
MLQLAPMNRPQTHLGSYQQAIRLFWKELYMTGGKTLYSQQHFGPTKPDWINIEHVFPMAWVVKSLKCRDRRDCRSNSTKFNFIESDMHNLFPSRRDLNMLRASHRFGSIKHKDSPNQDKIDKAIKGEVRLFGSYDFKVDNKRRMVEPAPASQGEIARAMFHMSETYKLKIFSKQAKTLAYWNKLDQPSKEEKRRNDIIEDLQGTRNHFIDYPKEIDNLL